VLRHREKQSTRLFFQAVKWTVSSDPLCGCTAASTSAILLLGQTLLLNTEANLDKPLLFFAGVLTLGIIAQWLAWRFKLPSILLLLATGFCCRYLLGLDPDQMLGEELIFPLVSLAVAVIMFEGGMTLQLHELKSSGNALFRLVTVGVVVAWVLTGLAAWFFVGMSPRVAALTGAILVVTGPTVIGPLLRHVRPTRRIASVVKWEGIVIDPIGAVLAVLVFGATFGAVHAGIETWSAASALATALILFKILATGISIASISAWALTESLKRYWIPDFLHNSVFLAVALATFTASQLIQDESGLVTVTILGILLANQKSVPVKHVVEFKENLRVLLISCLFIVLAARVHLADLTALGWGGAAFLVTLILIVRPISVWVATMGTELKRNERIFLAFLAPRGIVAAAVSAIFALHALGPHGEPVHGVVPAPAAETVAAADQGPTVAHPAPMSDIESVQQIVPLTFLVIVGTVLVYGLMAAPLARYLGLAVPNPQGILFAGAADWMRPIAKTLMEEGIPVLMVDTNYRNISTARLAGIPVHCASILSEFICEELDLSGIGRLIAATPNDDLNRLAALEFSHIFGRANTYQLPPWQSASGKREASTAHIEGRFLFGEDVNHGELASRMAQGAIVKRTHLTEEFTFSDFQAMYGESALVLFVKQANGDLSIVTTDGKLDPKQGCTLVALVDAEHA
jgi:NhaP-type Na+/H+ or K+/H+ antiporter